MSQSKGQTALQTLRQKVVQGEWAPGTKIPPRRDLLDALGVSHMTLHKAMEELARDGFIHANGRAGTFVRHHPPHRCRYALLVPFSRGKMYSRLWEALGHQADHLNLADTHHSVTVYRNIGNQRRDQAEYDELVRDIETHRVAGLIFAAQPHGLQGTPLLDQPDMPRVTIASDAFRPGMPTVSFEQRAWARRACERLIESGRRRVAVFATNADHIERDLAPVIEAHSLDMPPQWRLCHSPRSESGTRATAHLLMTLPPAERPDAILIADDHLVEPVTRGLTDARVQAPRDVQLIAHVNYPEYPTATQPVTWLGFDSAEVLRRCVEVIDRLREGRDAPAFQHVPAQFESELAAQAKTLSREPSVADAVPASITLFRGGAGKPVEH